MRTMTIAGVVALITVTFLMSAAPVDGQMPYVQTYFDPELHQTSSWCKGPDVIDTLYVVAHNFGMWLSTVEFSVSIPSSGVLMWIGDVHLNDPLSLGVSPTGITITWPLPQNAFDPLPFMGLRVLWICDECPEWDPLEWDMFFIRVLPHPGTGKLQAVRWPDYHVIEPIGMVSTLCPWTIGTEETTWGRVKALYR